MAETVTGWGPTVPTVVPELCPLISTVTVSALLSHLPRAKLLKVSLSALIEERAWGNCLGGEETISFYPSGSSSWSRD